MKDQVKIGLALGSGGARGLAHVGVLAVLEEAGFQPSCLAGTSMGSIVGGLYAEYPNAAVTWKRLQRYVNDAEFAASWSAFVDKDSGSEGAEPTRRFNDLFDFLQRKLIAIKTVTRPYQQDKERLYKPLENLFQARSFAELKIPFAAVALDLVSGQKVLFKEGPLIDGIYASSAIPAIFPPLERDGMMICDGGGPFRVPVEACRDLGADITVAVDIPAFDQEKFRTGLDLILRNNTIARQRLNKFVLATADLVIRPDVDDYHWADFRAGEACRDKGIEAAREALPRLRELVKQQGSLSYRFRRWVNKRLNVESPPSFDSSF
ncbi:MAG: patatin-like phospholipase family protein [bacterium]